MLVFYHFLWVEYGTVCDSLVFHQACQGGHFFGARFVGVGVGVLLEPCDLSDGDGDDTASDMFIRFSVISDMKSRNDLWELGLFFEKVTYLFKRQHWRREKYFLRPLDSLRMNG